jgi:hypothetical protein
LIEDRAQRLGGGSIPLKAAMTFDPAPKKGTSKSRATFSMAFVTTNRSEKRLYVQWNIRFYCFQRQFAVMTWTNAGNGTQLHFMYSHHRPRRSVLCRDRGSRVFQCGVKRKRVA